METNNSEFNEPEKMNSTGNQEPKKPVKKKGGIWRIIYPLLIAYGIQFVVTSGAMFVYMFKRIYSLGTDAMLEFIEDSEQINALLTDTVNAIYRYSNLITIVSSVITIALMLIFIKKDKKRLYREGNYVTYESPSLWLFALIIPLGIFASATANNLISISGLSELFSETEEILDQAFFSSDLITEIIALVILGPISEELVFRGLVYRRMRELLPAGVCIVFSSLIFGIYHGNVVQGIFAFLVALLMAFVLERYQSIWASIILHMAANGFSVFASETGVLEKYLTTTTSVIIYIAACAVLTILVLYEIYSRAHAKVLIPARGEEK